MGRDISLSLGVGGIQIPHVISTNIIENRRTHYHPVGMEVSTQSSLTPPWWMIGVPTYSLVRVCRWVGSMDTQLLQVGGGMDNFFVWCLTGVEFLLSKSLLSCSLPLSWSFDYREEAFVGPFFVYNHWHFQVSNFFSPKSETQKTKSKEILGNSPTCHSLGPKDSSPSAFFPSFQVIL